MDETQKKILSSVAEQGPTPLLITNTSGEIEYVNPAFTQVTGYTLEELRGKNPRILKSGRTPPEVYKELWETILSGRVWHGDLWNRRKDGEIFAESILIARLRDDEGKITHFVGMWQDVTQRKQAEEDLEHRAVVLEKESITDDLTGQYNRRHILEELEKEVERSRRYGRRLSGMMIDLDNFKQVNDQYGHPLGDRVLRTFSGILKKGIRKIDILGRYGGDEFIVILPESTVEVAHRVAARIQKNLHEYHKNVSGELFPAAASIGLISFENLQGVSRSAFVQKMDEALLRAKQSGKNRVAVG